MDLRNKDLIVLVHTVLVGAILSISTALILQKSIEQADHSYGYC